MAEQEVTGATPEEMEQMRQDFQERNESDWYEFGERFCCFQIPHQPEDYDGPIRHCKARARHSYRDGKIWRCQAHKGKGVGNVDSLTPGNPKHYMRASDEYLMDHLTDAEQELYDHILDWAEIYGISEEEDPAAYDDLKLLAKQRVREVKASKYLFEKGEIVDKLVRDEEGNVILDEDGEPKTEDDTNAASEEYRRLVNLISSLKRDLGITRKERMKAEDRNIAAESADTASEAMQELVADDDKEFDVSEYSED
jgi:hypothetical protein